MSGIREEKIDNVVAMLTEALTDNEVLKNDSKAEVYKYMLYANPNGSGMVNLKGGKTMSEGTVGMISSILSGEAETAYYALPTNSVAIHIRMRHTISELLKKHEILSFMRSHIYHRIAKGEEGKLRYVEGTEEKVVGPAQLSSIRASIKDAMTIHLPAIVDDCYAVKYGAAGNFTYSLVDVKMIKVLPAYIEASLSWLQTHVNDDVSVTSQRKHIEDWYKYTKNTRSHISKYGDHLTKLFKTICARAGRYRDIKAAQLKPDDLFDGHSKENVISHYSTVISRLDRFIVDYINLMSQNDTVTGFHQQLDSGEHQVISESEITSNKKYYQNILYKALLSHVRAAAYNYAVVANNDESFMRMFNNQYQEYMTGFIQSMLRVAHELNTNISVVFGDTFNQSSLISLSHCITEIGRNSGTTNARVLNALYKFFSVASQVDDLNNGREISSRKSLPESVDAVIHQALNHNHEKMEQYRSSNRKNQENGKDLAPLKMRQDFGGLKCGYLQTGVMIIKSLICPETTGTPETDDNYSHIANCLDHWADSYEAIHIARIEERKKAKSSGVDLSSLASATNLASPGISSGNLRPVSTFGASAGESKADDIFSIPSAAASPLKADNVFSIPPAVTSPSLKATSTPGSAGVGSSTFGGVGSSTFGGVGSPTFGGVGSPSMRQATSFGSPSSASPSSRPIANPFASSSTDTTFGSPK
jgi:hypothetical protein